MSTVSAARQFFSALTFTTIDKPKHMLRIHFQRWPGRDATSGVENGVTPKTIKYTVKADGVPVDNFRDKEIGEGGLVLVPFVPGKKFTLDIFGTTYSIKVLEAMESAGTTAGRQRRLNALGYELNKVDGSVGPLTDRSTLNFQADNPPIVIDGLIGTETQPVLVDQVDNAP